MKRFDLVRDRQRLLVFQRQQKHNIWLKSLTNETVLALFTFCRLIHASIGTLDFEVFKPIHIFLAELVSRFI